MVFEGPAGIGKSSLLAAARTAAAADLRVLSARGGELERELPFGIVRQLLEPVVAGLRRGGASTPCWPGRRRWRSPSSLRPIRRPAPSRRFPPCTGSTGSRSTWPTHSRCCVAVDDAHWADLASLRWLIYLARRLAGVPLALLLATRPAEPGPVQELLDELLVIPEVAVLQPGGLSERAITMLAVQLLAAEPDPSFVTACRRATGGNPFLLLELFGELDRRGIAPSRENAGLASQLSSHGVGRAVRARLRRLPPECTALARAVAVLGDPTEPALAARARRPRRRRGRPRRRRAGRGGDLRARPAARVRPPARALERLLRAELPGACPTPRARRPPAHRCGRGTGPDCRSPPGDPSRRRRGDGGDAATGGQGRKRSRRPGRRRHVPPASARRAAVAGARTGARRTSWAAPRSAPASSRWRSSCSGRRLGTLPTGRLRAEAANALGSALFLAHRPEEAMTELTAVIDELPESEREQGLRLQATRWAAVRGSVAAWRRLQATGERFVVTSPHAADDRRAPARRRRGVRRRPDGDGRTRRASWPSRRSRTGGYSKTRVRSRVASGSRRPCSSSPTPTTTGRGSAPR